MRKYLINTALGLALLAFAAGPVAAQVSMFGAQGGVSIAEIDVDGDDDNLDSRTGMHVGLFVDWALTPGIGIRPGVYYTSGGATYDIGGGNDEQLTLDYVQIPVLLRFGVPLNMPFAIHALAGPYVGFETVCEFELNEVADAVDCDSPNLEDEFATKNTEFGLQFGAGLGFGVADGINLLLEGGYQLGLTDMSDTGGTESLKNRRWLVDLGITVDLTR